MKFALIQLNLTIGDIEGNARRIISAVSMAKEAGAYLCITSELALIGYPPRDLLLNRAFINRAWKQLDRIAYLLRDCPPVLVGIAEPNLSGQGRPLFNSAVLLRDGKICGKFRKTLLPTYDVFDEDRYFVPSSSPGLLELEGMKIGVTICEDIWNDKDFWKVRRYNSDPMEQVFKCGIDCIVNLSGSPFTLGKQNIREAMLGSMAKKYSVPRLYVNQV